MKPFLFADWRMINRVFCFLVWMVALALTIMIIGHFVAASSACATGSSAQHGSVCIVTGTRGRAVPRRAQP